MNLQRCEISDVTNVSKQRKPNANSIQPAGMSYKPPKAIGAFVWDELEMFAGTGGKSSPEACSLIGGGGGGGFFGGGGHLPSIEEDEEWWM